MPFKFPTEETLRYIAKCMKEDLPKMAIEKAMYATLGQGIWVTHAVHLIREYIPSFRMSDLPSNWREVYNEYRLTTLYSRGFERLRDLKQYISDVPFLRGTKYRYKVYYTLYDMSGERYEEHSKWYYADEYYRPSEIVRKFAKEYQPYGSDAGYKLSNFRYGTTQHNYMWTW